MQTITKLSLSEITLHWIVAVGIICLIGAGLYMSEYEVWSLYPIHKSMGILLFTVIVVRAVMRLQAGWPENISKGKAFEHGIARVVHWVLIIGTLLMPISGMMMSGFGGHGLDIFGLQIIGENIDAAGKTIPVNGELAGIGHFMHEVLGKVLIASIVLHIVGAFKHHIIDRDNTLRRMLGR